MNDSTDALRDLLGQIFPPDEQEEPGPLDSALQKMNDEAREARILAEAAAMRAAASPIDTPNTRKWLQDMNDAAQEPDALDTLLGKFYAAHSGDL